ncbi:hypothetical protein [Azonexus sp. IMCC34839]|uniref:hypothetical protein n=1 Tax=Azonexus sp. IMCC34839 TaxID=3133695 RepID=UPI00399AD17C
MSQVIISEVIGKVGLIHINRPEMMNVQNREVVDGFAAGVDAFVEKRKPVLKHH